jgi:hypothetical protein
MRSLEFNFASITGSGFSLSQKRSKSRYPIAHETLGLGLAQLGRFVHTLQQHQTIGRNY